MSVNDYNHTYGFQVTTKTLPESCVDCPFWFRISEMVGNAEYECYLSGRTIRADEAPDQKRMDDCQLIVRPDQKYMRNLTAEETEKMLQRMKAETLRSIRRSKMQQTRLSLYSSFLGAIDMAENMKLISMERKKQLYEELEQEANQNG